MSINSTPDYELAELAVVTEPAVLHALFDPLRGTLLDLLLERAASVSELARAVGRPRSTIAHHVSVLQVAGLLRVVRTRRVRAIDERFYGRTARIFRVGEVPLADIPPEMSNAFVDAARESEEAHRADTMWTLHRHARITRAQAREFWTRVDDLVREFSALPREGDQVFGFAVGLYPTQFPTLPAVVEEES